MSGLDGINTITVQSQTLQGEKRVWLCPICEAETDVIGNLESPFRTVMGERMCDNCKKDIRELISTYINKR